MAKKTLAILLSLIILYSCSDDKNKRPETAMETGTTFIRASLDGDFKTTEELLLKDTPNIEQFQSYKRFYERMSGETKKNYKSASYKINKYQDVDDSTAIINYSNSFMNKPMEIKIVRQNKLWCIDFKYISSGNLPID